MSEDLEQTQGSEVEETADSIVESAGVPSTDDSADPGVTDDAGSSEQIAPGEATDGEAQGVPAEFPAGLLLVAEAEGETQSDVIATIKELGIAGAKKYYGRLRAQMLKGINPAEFIGGEDRQEPARRETQPQPKAPAKTAENKRDFLSPDRLKAIVGWHNDDGIVDGLLGPMGEQINEHMDALREEMTKQFAPVMQAYQAQENARFEAAMEADISKLAKAGFESKYGSKPDARTPAQKLAVNNLLGLAAGIANKAAKGGKRMSGYAAMLAAHELLNDETGGALRSEAVKSVRGQLVNRSRQITVAPGARSTVQAKAKTPEQERAEKINRVKSVMADKA